MSLGWDRAAVGVFLGWRRPPETVVRSAARLLADSDALIDQGDPDLFAGDRYERLARTVLVPACPTGGWLLVARAAAWLSTLVFLGVLATGAMWLASRTAAMGDVGLLVTILALLLVPPTVAMAAHGMALRHGARPEVNDDERR